MKERGATILARLYRYQDSQNIAFDDETNPWILMSDDLATVINTKIYLVSAFKELARYVEYLDGVERILTKASH